MKYCASGACTVRAPLSPTIGEGAQAPRAILTPAQSAAPASEGDPPRTPRVGVGVLVFREGRVLLGRRRGVHGADTWAPPGGHLEFGETVSACAAREVAEETGLTVGQLIPGPYVSFMATDTGQHYVTLFVEAHDVSGRAEVREPDKCHEWLWFPWSALPSPLFAPLAELVRTDFVPVASARDTPNAPAAADYD